VEGGLESVYLFTRPTMGPALRERRLGGVAIILGRGIGLLAMLGIRGGGGRRTGADRVVAGIARGTIAWGDRIDATLNSMLLIVDASVFSSLAGDAVIAVIGSDTAAAADAAAVSVTGSDTASVVGSAAAAPAVSVVGSVVSVACEPSSISPSPGMLLPASASWACF